MYENDGFFHFSVFLEVMLICDILFNQMYEIKEEGGIVKKLSEIWRKLSEPLQPQVPQEDTKMKSLSYPFSREKIYL